MPEQDERLSMTKYNLTQDDFEITWKKNCMNWQERCMN